MLRLGPLLLFTCLSILGTIPAADLKISDPFEVPIPTIYAKPCQSLDLWIGFSDDGGIAMGPRVRLERQDDGSFQRQSLANTGYWRSGSLTFLPLPPVTPDQVAAWLKRLAIIDVTCRSQITPQEAFSAISDPERNKEKLKAFIKQYGSLPEGRVSLNIRITSTDGTLYHWEEGLDNGDKEASALLREMTTSRP